MLFSDPSSDYLCSLNSKENARHSQSSLETVVTYDSLFSGSTRILLALLLKCGGHHHVPHKENRTHAPCAQHAPALSIDMPNRRARVLPYLVDFFGCCVPRASIPTHVVT